MNPEHPYAQAQFPAMRGDAPPAIARDRTVFENLPPGIEELAHQMVDSLARPPVAAPDVRIELHLFRSNFTRVARMSAAECADPETLARALIDGITSTAPAPLDADTDLQPRARITILMTPAADVALCTLIERAKDALVRLLGGDVCAPPQE